MFADVSGPVGAGCAAAAAASCAPGMHRPRGRRDLLLDGMVAMLLEEYADCGADVAARPASASAAKRVASEAEIRWIVIAAQTSSVLWDFDRLAGARPHARSSSPVTPGALVTLPLVLIPLHRRPRARRASWRRPASLLMELRTVAEVTGSRHPALLRRRGSPPGRVEKPRAATLDRGQGQRGGREGRRIEREHRRVGERGPVERSRPLRGSPRGGGPGQRGPAGGSPSAVVVSTWGWSSSSRRRLAAGRRSIAANALAAALGADSPERHRLGIRDRGAVTRRS